MRSRSTRLDRLGGFVTPRCWNQTQQFIAQSLGYYTCYWYVACRPFFHRICHVSLHHGLVRFFETGEYEFKYNLASDFADMHLELLQCHNFQLHGVCIVCYCMASATVSCEYFLAALHLRWMHLSRYYVVFQVCLSLLGQRFHTTYSWLVLLKVLLGVRSWEFYSSFGPLTCNNNPYFSLVYFSSFLIVLLKYV